MYNADVCIGIGIPAQHYSEVHDHRQSIADRHAQCHVLSAGRQFLSVDLGGRFFEINSDEENHFKQEISCKIINAQCQNIGYISPTVCIIYDGSA